MKKHILSFSLWFITVLCLAQATSDKPYGVVDLSVGNLRSKPNFSSEMITQALLGMPVKILQTQSWIQIQTPDEYVGWVHRTAIAPMTLAEYQAWNRSEKIVVTAHAGFTYEKPNLNAQPVSDVVAGDRLKWIGKKGKFYHVSYPGGRQAYIPTSIATPENAWRKAVKQDANSIIRTAYSLMGTPYLWAGTSSKGVDCSGFVRTVLYMHDIIIPRDASQQARVGERVEIDPDWNNLQAGDLLFFGSKATADKKERVVHVGIYLGNRQFIHSQGDVHVSSLNPTDENFDTFNLNRLLYAGRVLPFINKQEGLNTTDTNSYYTNK